MSLDDLEAWRGGQDAQRAEDAEHTDRAGLTTAKRTCAVCGVYTAVPAVPRVRAEDEERRAVPNSAGAGFKGPCSLMVTDLTSSSPLFETDR